jgi:redox-sensitive bicupin YhaK (pirin superfamily)
MMHHTKAKMFLADERGMDETNWSRNQSTFNFEKYFNENKTPFGDLYVVNDEVLDAGHSLIMSLEENCCMILLPVMGAIAVKDSSGNENLIAAGQMQALFVDYGDSIGISNPFEEGLVNFLQLRIRGERTKSTPNSDIYTYEINKYTNTLLTISPVNLGESVLPFSISIGKFDGRGEADYRLKNRGAGLFVFAIEGAFEVQGTLLHARDGLALWDTEEAEIEALSNDAIILLLELPLKKRDK